MKWKKGQKVVIEVHVGGIVTEEEGVVSEINKKGVYLDNGEGNDPNGPFDKNTGEHITIREVGMLGSQIIRPKK
jgi:hypothetical protein